MLTRMVGVQGEYADHLTTTAARYLVKMDAVHGEEYVGTLYSKKTFFQGIVLVIQKIRYPLCQE